MPAAVAARVTMGPLIPVGPEVTAAELVRAALVEREAPEEREVPVDKGEAGPAGRSKSSVRSSIPATKRLSIHQEVPVESKAVRAVCCTVIIQASATKLRPPRQIGDYSGSVDSNPFLANSPSTPDIVGLVGGADAYGLLNALTTSLFTTAVTQTDAPGDAEGMLVRVATGSAGYGPSFPGYDILLYADLSGEGLLDPKLGVGNVRVPLLQGGYANNPEFGGSGPQVITELGAYQVYATLVPTTANQFQISASFGGTVKVAESALNDGQILYLTNSPTTAVPVNQQIALQGATFDGATWQDLGSMTVSGNSGTIRVQLSNTGSGNLAADAVQVVQNVLPNLQYVNLSGNHLNNAAYNYVLPGLTAQRPGGFPAIASNPADPAVAGLVYDSDPNAPTFTQTIATQSATAGSTTTVTLANIVNGVATNGVATDLDGDTITYGASSNNSQVAATVATVNGNILLQVTPQVGMTAGYATITLTAGDRASGGDAEGRTAQQSFVVLVGTGEITGSVYSDNNGNGVKDPGEGIAGYSVYEDLNNSGAYVTGDPVTVTDSNGNYAFYGVDLGKPTVVREDTTSPAWSRR